VGPACKMVWVRIPDGILEVDLGDLYAAPTGMPGYFHTVTPKYILNEFLRLWLVSGQEIKVSLKI
jgi:hypothetical protein